MNKHRISLTEGEIIIIREALRVYGYPQPTQTKEVRDLYEKEISSVDDKMTKKLAHIFDLNELERNKCQVVNIF